MKKVTLLAFMLMIAISYNKVFATGNVFDDDNAHLKIEQVKPNRNNIILQFNCPEDQTVTLNLVDARGQVVYNKEISALKGLNTEQIDIDVQAANFLMILLNNNVEQDTKRIIATSEYAVVN